MAVFTDSWRKIASLIGKTPQGSKWAVVNEGVAGNRLLAEGPIASFGLSALARFDRDALSIPVTRKRRKPLGMR
jgi:hypothetical protein